MATDQNKHIEKQPTPETATINSAPEAAHAVVEQPSATPRTPEQGVPIEGAREMEGVHIEESGGFSEAIENITNKLRKPKKKKATLDDVHIIRDEVTKEVEHIMEDGLSDAFKELSPTEAQAFKVKGEETAREIRQLLKSTRVRIKKIFELLYEWLKLLPGVNSFFLEQEAKIKADKIMALHQRQMSHRALNINGK